MAGLERSKQHLTTTATKSLRRDPEIHDEVAVSHMALLKQLAGAALPRAASV